MSRRFARLRETGGKISIALRGQSSGELIAPPAATVADAVLVGIGLLAASLFGIAIAFAQAAGWIS